MRRLVLIVLALITTTPAGAQSGAASKFCSTLDERSAASSPDCVRWQFACNMGSPSTSPKPPYDQISYQERYRLLVHATFRVAEIYCDHFSYVEAWAAMQAHLATLSSPRP